MKKLSNLPPKGTYDWFPEEFAIRKYIFDKWREVCTKFGYEEYLTPILENAEIYKAKSGEDVAGPELMIIKKPDEELAIRPEMTPSVTRMVTRFYEGKAKPIRLFSIANYYRFQKPQRGRNREFWQLNFDIFGSTSINADIEILQMALEIMLAFNPPQDSFVMYINNRKLIDYILDTGAQVTADQRIEVVRILDKWEKLSQEEFAERLFTVGLTNEQVDVLAKFMTSNNAEELANNIAGITENEGYKEIVKITKTLQTLGYSNWVKFQPNVIRGFDYYDGMVFEVFDKNPNNSRSLFGGGRYNGLAAIFGSNSFPAVGCAPGDETLRLFIEAWNLIPESITKRSVDFYLPLQDDIVDEGIYSFIANTLRTKGFSVLQSVEIVQMGKAFKEATSIGAKFIVIYGEFEQQDKSVVIKDLATRKQYKLSLDRLTSLSLDIQGKLTIDGQELNEITD